jgi:methionine synthase II (cobalamin-independent)
MSSKKSQNHRSYKKTYKRKSKNTVKDIADKVRKEMAEIKRANPLVVQDELIYQYLPTNAFCNTLMPVITQGAGQGQRIGNSVQTRKAKLHLKIGAVQVAGTPSIGPNYFDIYI